ncbi:MAG: orotidine-5'-phosphate decarboxylase [Chloroflexota bacterium]|nr:orotidine-5'-phosphate decarboxylase [Chloroflexota bacterium]
MRFQEKLDRAISQNKSMVCVGLDPDPKLMPDMGILEFNRAIIEATMHVACAYKLNFAFYEVLGAEGMAILEETLKCIPPHIPTIGDAKRGDIGNTSRMYAKAIFETMGFDATTVNPYLGFDSVDPFLKYEDNGVFILCRTSNPGAHDFQDPLFGVVAQKAKEWNYNGNVGLVMGATYPNELKDVRSNCPGMVLLIPGLGPQGGDPKLAVRNGLDINGSGAIFAFSRQILYASNGVDFAQEAQKSAETLRQQIESLI